MSSSVLSLSVCVPLKGQLTSLLFHSPAYKLPSLHRYREEDYSLERSGMLWVNKGTEADIEALHIKNRGLEDEKSCEQPRSLVFPGWIRLWLEVVPSVALSLRKLQAQWWCPAKQAVSLALSGTFFSLALTLTGKSAGQRYEPGSTTDKALGTV